MTGSVVSSCLIIAGTNKRPHSRVLAKASSNVGPYGLFWQPALVRYSSILYLCLLIGQIKMLACLLAGNALKDVIAHLFITDVLNNEYTNGFLVVVRDVWPISVMIGCVDR